MIHQKAVLISVQLLIEIPVDLMTNEYEIIAEIFGNKIKINDTNLKNKDIMEGQIVEYLSIDTTEGVNRENLDVMLPTEFLNSLAPNGLLSHKLQLEVGAIVILLRKKFINLNESLCNGTRLLVKKLMKYSIQAENLSGKNMGELVFILRISLSTSKEEIPFNMRRKQFPIRLGFAMTINKSEGQSYNEVGIYLPTPVFYSHGQLYVALSRVKSRKNLKILLLNNAKVETDKLKHNQKERAINLSKYNNITKWQ